MYTGMNFLPLCTAMVCPIISGTIVDRRDHVFTTFFSFRELSASTLFRRGASTNGPFFNERAIAVLPYPTSANSQTLFIHPPQFDPLRAAHLAEPAHRAGNPVRMRAERANETRTLLARLPFYQHRPS
jgi:hypothetical protein